MNVLPVGQFKAQFSSILQQVQKGSSVGISYGKNKKKIAVLMPYKKYLNKSKTKLGLLEGKASVSFFSDFKMSDDEFFRS